MPNEQVKGVLMNNTDSNYRKVFRLLTILLTGLLTVQNLSAQGWYDNGWSYRQAVTVPNPAGADLTNYQVKVSLSSGVNFDFSKVLSDGSDFRLTASDGTTLIPFCIEELTPGTSATIWVKLPLLPASGTTVYLYFGNAAPTLPSFDPVESPPIGPYTRDTGNPIVPIGDPGTGASLLAENIAYDPVTGHYWMVFANYRSGSQGVGLVWSDTPTDATSWHWHGNIYTAGTSGSYAPHIIYENGLWHVFFAIRPNIVYITCSTIDGTYSAPTTVLSPSETWETYRVDEPYVFRRNDGRWVLVYMGDAGSTTELIGYATADNIGGPYTKYSGNPCLTFGPAGSYDAGTVADPWIYEYHGVYYIGYTVSPTKSSPWSTACATTTDWETFTKLGVIFPVASSGWDSNNSFRGAVTRINDEYVFSYTGDSYRMGIATQPVFVIPGDIINNPDAVFDFYDGFNTGADPDPVKWTFVSGNPATHTTVENGLLAMTATGITAGTYVRIDGRTSFGPGYIGETYARHPNQGTENLIGEVGFVQGSFANTIRIVDDFPSVTNWQRQSKTSTTIGDPKVNMAQTADQGWHVFRLYRQSSVEAGFQIDNNAFETVNTEVPTVDLAPFLMSFGNSNQFVVDWTRVRKWAGPDPVTAIGNEEALSTHWTGAVSSEWTAAGNWSAGVPEEWNLVTVPASGNAPVLNGSLTVNPTASLTIEAGGALTVTGDFSNNGAVTIGSTLESSGSLIVEGTGTGLITYNRQLLPGSVAEGNWHLVSAPVQNNSATNATKVSEVYEWSEVTGAWITSAITTALTGHGYNIRQTAGSDGLITFTGTTVNGDILVAASSPYADAIGPGGNYFNRAYITGRSPENLRGKGWNLFGNPYTSAISASEFIGANYSATPSLSQFDPNYLALYLFDGTDRRYYYIGNPTGWSGGGELAETHVQAGQGFFVLAMNDNSEFTFTRAMQEHSTATAMLKSRAVDDRWPGLQLKVGHPAGEVMTTVVYSENMTTGVDPGYDIGLFKSGQEMEVYTSLALKDNGINYTRQALPVSGADTLVIPVGVDFKDGGEVTFSASTVPVDGRRFWLEDRTMGIFTDISLKSYTVTLPAKSYGTGRFYLLASANTPTGTEQLTDGLAELRIWVSNGRMIIKGEVGEGAKCEIYDMNGRMLLKSLLTDGELNTVGLPYGLYGVVLIKVTDGVKITTRKVAIL
jgi:hypothetical protein